MEILVVSTDEVMGRMGGGERKLPVIPTTTDDGKISVISLKKLLAVMKLSKLIRSEHSMNQYSSPDTCKVIVFLSIAIFQKSVR